MYQVEHYYYPGSLHFNKNLWTFLYIAKEKTVSRWSNFAIKNSCKGSSPSFSYVDTKNVLLKSWATQHAIKWFWVTRQHHRCWFAVFSVKWFLLGCNRLKCIGCSSANYLNGVGFVSFLFSRKVKLLYSALFGFT